MKKYLRGIYRRLNMPRKLRRRVMNDLESSIASRRESGQSDETIMAELGTPRQAAAELNRQMEEYTYRKSPWRWVCLALVALSALSFLFQGSLGLLTAIFNFRNRYSVGIIGGADGPTSIFISAPANYFTQQMIVALIVFILSAAGFWLLSHIRRK